MPFLESGIIFLLYFSLSPLLFLAFEEDGQKTNIGMCHE